MAAPTYQASSHKGAMTFLGTCVIPVPSGTAIDDVVVATVAAWDDTAGTVTITPPSGFTEITAATEPRDGSGGMKVWTYEKRLTAADSGSYTFTLNSTEWNTGAAVLARGAVASGTAVDAADVTYGAGYSTPPVVTITATGEDLYVHFLTRENAGTSTPPTGYAEVQEDIELTVSHKTGTGAGTEAPTGGTSSVTTNGHSVLVGLKPAATGDAGYGYLEQEDDVSRFTLEDASGFYLLDTTAAAPIPPMIVLPPRSP